jgi:hypothetical protein
VVEKRREHSRKPDCVRDRIERLVLGPYLELFARETKQGRDCWGNQVALFDRGAVSLAGSHPASWILRRFLSGYHSRQKNFVVNQRPGQSLPRDFDSRHA